jgi:hypothetical protein
LLNIDRSSEDLNALNGLIGDVSLGIEARVFFSSQVP